MKHAQPSIDELLRRRDDYLKQRQRLIDAGLVIAHSRLLGQLMLLNKQDGWEPLDLDKAEKYLFPDEQDITT